MPEQQGSGATEIENEVPEVVDQEAYEELARKDGWVPLPEWRGEKANWVDAKEFIGRKPLFDHIKELRGEIKQRDQQYKNEMQMISTYMATMQEQEYNRALATLNAEKRVAVEERDPDSVEAIDKRIEALRTKQAQLQVKTQPKESSVNTEETEAFRTWRSDNKWFDDDPEMRDEAIAIGIGYSARERGKNKNPQEKDVYAYVDRRMRKLYPEYFDKDSTTKEDQSQVTTTDENKARGATASKVEAGRTGPTRSKSSAPSERDLSEMERKVMDTLLKRGVLKDVAKKNNRSEKEEYLAQLAASKGL